ncbi:MAG: hypothetical protein JW860_14450 [Sedimentisphaerales bacterium]|nr:hypothetical protein [Sedimentisphaerales bacterium]
MNIKPLEGTFYIDGLLEGPVFGEGDEDLIRRFVRRAAKDGFIFSLAIDGGRFSLLAEKQPGTLPESARSADSLIARHLNEFLDNYRPEEAAQMMSTIRSVEFIPSQEVQTVYGIMPDGKLALEQRKVKAETIKPPRPLSLKEKIRVTGVLVVILAIVFGVSMIFVPYRQLFGRIADSVRPYKIETLEIEQGYYTLYFNIESTEVLKKKLLIRMQCRPTELFPQDVNRLNTIWEVLTEKDPEHAIVHKMALEAIWKKYIRCEMFNAEGEYLGQEMCRMFRDQDDKNVFSLYIPFDKKIRKVVLTF